jgi:hypothetical protein
MVGKIERTFMALASSIDLRRVLATAGVIALVTILTALPAAAQTGAKARPTNLSEYSLRYWPQNALLRGQTVRANTPYGVLTCTSIGPSHPRQCSLR